MKLESIHEEWDKDQEFDIAKPDETIRRVPLLHSKYWRIYTGEKQSFVVIKQAHDQLRHAKFEWYTGRMDDVERQKRGWPHQQLRLARQEVDMYLNADTELVTLYTKMELQELKLSLLTDIIKSINARGYLVKSYVEYLRWSQGQI